MKRFDQVEESCILTQATLLDPRFKNCCFRGDDKKKNAIRSLTQELGEQEPQAVPHAATQPPATKKGKRPSLWDSLEEMKEQKVFILMLNIHL